MNTNVQIKQLEGVMISHDNTLNSMKQRIADKEACIEAINKPGRPDAVIVEYGDRTMTLPIEEPNKYAAELEDFLIKLIQADIANLKQAIAKEEVEKKKTEKELEELKASVEAAPAKKAKV